MDSSIPTVNATNTPSQVPTKTQTPAPSVSQAPSRYGMFQLVLTYGIMTSAGIDASAVRTATDNTVAADLVVAVTTVVLDILDQDLVSGMLLSPRTSQRMRLPRLRNDADVYSRPHAEKHSDDMTRRKRRRLATYLQKSPVYHKNIFDNECKTPSPDYLCIVVKSVVTVYLDNMDTEASIRSLIVGGFNEAMNDGSFLAAIPT